MVTGRQPLLMDPWFLFKKGVSLFLHPLPIALELMVIGLLLVGFSRRKSRRSPEGIPSRLRKVAGHLGIAALIAGVGFLYLCSIKPVADSLVHALESQHPPLSNDADRPAPAFIVVLASGERYRPGKPATSQLSYAALARVVEGVRLAADFPGSRVVFTGQPGEVRGMTETAVALGVDPERIIGETESRDTKDHPIYLREILGEESFVLVTSGTHMPRSLILFRGQGLDPVPAPCDLWVWPGLGEESPWRPGHFIPKVEHLWKTHVAFHEFLGLAWAAIKEEAGAGPAAAKPEIPPGR